MARPYTKQEERKAICPVCGKEFTTKRPSQKTCSAECANRARGGKWTFLPADGSGKCMVCGTPAKYAFCCQACASSYKDGSYKRPLYEYEKGLGTAGLIKKWHEEGDSPEKIAQVLCRDIKVIREVLENDNRGED